MNDNAQESFTYPADLGGTGHSVVEFHPFSQPPDRPGRRVTFDARQVLLRNSRARMRDQVCESSVVRENDEAFGVHVEATHWKDAYWRLH
jgi:hypothetical protein